MTARRPESNLTDHPPTKPILLKNRGCLYCGYQFSEETLPTKEHVIGRNFVPRGTLAGQWNLIANACARCNSLKADLENDISAITMAPNSIGKFAVDDERLRREAIRKAARAISRRTRKTVDKSMESLKISVPFGSMTMKFDVVSPPQVDDNRIFELAYMHFSAFFYLITYDKDSRLGRFVMGNTNPYFCARRGNWGAPEVKWFTGLTESWPMRLLAIGADGFFKVVIRRQSEDSCVWSWAFEWNQSTRVIGFSGHDNEVDNLLRDAPVVELQSIHEGNNEWIRYRQDSPLDGTDTLFHREK